MLFQMLKGITSSHLLSSSFTLSSSLWVSSNISLTSCSLVLNSSFSSLHNTLMHFGGLCCFGCLPPKCGCAGRGGEELPKICVMTISLCCADMLVFNSFSFFEALRLLAPVLADVFLALLAFPRRIRNKIRLSCNFLTGQCVSSDDKDKKCSNTVMHELAGVIILITVGIHLYDQTTKRFSKLVFLINSKFMSNQAFFSLQLCKKQNQ